MAIMGIAREILKAFLEELKDPYFHRSIAEILITMIGGCVTVVAVFVGLWVTILCAWALFGCLLPALGINL